MRIGARAHDFGRLSAKELARRIKAAGFETVQLALTKAMVGIQSFEEISRLSLSTIREAFAAEALSIDVLGCYIEPSLAGEEKRQQQVGFFLEGICHAKALGVPIIATETTAFRGGEREREEACQRLRASVTAMAERARQEGIFVAVEPVALHTLNTPALARRLLDEVASPNLKIIFDPVNLLESHTIQRQDQIWEETFRLLGKDIVAIHLKDVDESLAWKNLGQGVVNYPLIFRYLRELKKDLPLLREHVKMDSYQADIAAIKNWTLE